MEFRIDVKKSMKVLNWIYGVTFLLTITYSIVKCISEGLVIEMLIIIPVLMLTMASILLIGQKYQKRRYMKCVVKVDEKGVFIRDLSGKDKYFFYADIKHICMSTDKYHAFVISHNNGSATILNQMNDYPILIDLLKKKNITFVRTAGYAELQRCASGYDGMDRKKIAILSGMMLVVMIVVHMIGASSSSKNVPQETYVQIEDDGYELTRQHIDQLIELSPNRAELYVRRGEMFSSEYRLEEAIEDYSRAIELDNQNADYYIERAALYINVSQPENALEDYNRALAIRPGESNWFALRAHAYLFLEREDEALADTEASIKLDPKNAYPYYLRAFIFHSMQDWHKAIEECNKYIALDPHYYFIYRLRGNAYEAIGETEKANADNEKAKLLGA